PRVRDGGDLQLAPVAAPRVHLADVERAPQLAADARSQAGRRLGQADPCVNLYVAERAAPGRRIDVEHGGPCELLATVRGDFDAGRDTDSLFRTPRDALSALDAGGV